MRTYALRGAAVAGATVLATLASTLPAAADTRTFADRAGDTGIAADITTVTVTNGSTPSGRVSVRAHVGHLTPGDLVTVWFDTVPGDPGPEYKLAVYANAGGQSLRKLESFGQAGTVVPCDGIRARADAFGPDVVSVSVPRSCLQNPHRVRVSLRARFASGEHAVTDWAPAKRHFFGWVRS